MGGFVIGLLIYYVVPPLVISLIIALITSMIISLIDKEVLPIKDSAYFTRSLIYSVLGTFGGIFLLGLFHVNEFGIKGYESLSNIIRVFVVSLYLIYPYGPSAKSILPFSIIILMPIYLTIYRLWLWHLHWLAVILYGYHHHTHDGVISSFYTTNKWVVIS